MKKILIVDDSSYMRIFVRKIIQKKGNFMMLEASNKGEAIELFNNELPEIVILDLNISEIREEGLEILTEIMKINPETSVIIISAVGYEEVKDECLKLGAKTYLRKPFDTEDLLNALKNMK